jgi:hypothetical protein
MITNGPFSLSNGTAITVPDPQNLLGTSSAKVQIQNASPFIVTVSALGQFFTLQEFTAQTIPLTGDGTPITLTPSNGPAGTQGELEVVWLLSFETSPMADGQLTGAAQYAIGLGSLLEINQPLNFGSPNVVALPPITKTVIISATSSGGLSITRALVRGGTTGIIYYSQRPYLTDGSTYYMIVIPIVAVLEASLVITFTGALGVSNNQWSIAADTAQYPESTFYSGEVNTVGINAPGTVLTGPARLLTAEIFSTAGGAANLLIGGTEVMRAPAATTQNTLSFPPNTLLQGAQTVTAAGNVSQATVVYAYP